LSYLNVGRKRDRYRESDPFIDSALSLTPEQIERHNKLYDEAWKLLNGEVNLDGRELRKPGWLATRRLHKAKALFEETIAINAAGWNAMFAIAKIEQRFGRKQEALDWLLKAREFEPRNTSLAKEASLSASRVGMHEMAACIADEAIELNPTDPALKVNSGLAHILAGHCENAVERFGDAARLEPAREVNKKLHEYALKVLAGTVPKPKTESDILRVIQ
jgi:tetratricopeptide (TPR) repeat protein